VTEEQIRWIAETAVRLDCIVFICKGIHGAQPILFPRSLYGRKTTLHQD
jgi:hypothetical protein